MLSYLFMKISTFEDFGARNSVPVFAAFRQAAEKSGAEVVSHDATADVAVIWSVVWAGRMRRNQAIWQQFRDSGRPVIVLEVGMLHRGHTWKIGINGTGADAVYCASQDPDRPKQLGLTLMPWNTAGQHVLIAMQRSDSEQWAGMPPADRWLSDTVQTLRQHTDREIRVRPHPRQPVRIPRHCMIEHPKPLPGTYDSFDIAHNFNRAWAVVNHNSGPGCIGVIQGCPAFVGASSLANSVGNLDLAMIENPQRPDRDQWLISLSHTEWTLPEIQQGHCVDSILKMCRTGLPDV